MKKTAKPKTAAEHKREKVMAEFERHELHTGSKSGPLVTNPKQAVAIAYSEGRKKTAELKKDAAHKSKK